MLATLATYSNLNAAAGYSQKSFNVSAYKGQTIQVYLVGTEDSSLQTSFVVDDFALNSSRKRPSRQVARAAKSPAAAQQSAVAGPFFVSFGRFDLTGSFRPSSRNCWERARTRQALLPGRTGLKRPAHQRHRERPPVREVQACWTAA